MTTEEQMTIDERYKYLRKMQTRYRKASRTAKGALLDEMMQVTELRRKSLIRLMSSTIQRTPRRKQRGLTYGADVTHALAVIAESFDYICAERLTPNLGWMAKLLATHDELETTPDLLAKLEAISIPTVQRRLQGLPRDTPRLRVVSHLRKGPIKANKIAREIPMTRIPWDEQTPGYLEVDLVHHCGPTTAGEYVHTLQLVDVATGWSERVAVLGRSYLVMADASRYIQGRIPFPIRELHVDNGAEFINQHIARFWQDLITAVHLSRNRPYHPNDNRFVEQKNSTLVRAYFGKDRLDSVAQVIAMNRIYEDLWVYYNLLQPVMRLEDKVYVTEDGRTTRVKRRFDQARTPFDRLCVTDAISEVDRAQLDARRQQTNPRALRCDIYDAVVDLFELPGAVPGHTENVYETLFYPDDIAETD